MAARELKTGQQRRSNQLREVRIKRHYTTASPGSVLLEMGKTVVLCTASIADHVPEWMQGSERGWMTAEYNMLPHSTTPRRRRDRNKVDGRTTEIQRLIGRSLRAVADLEALGERTITIDCDVLQADGGTRTASITGALIAVVDALAVVRSDLPDPHRYPLRDSVAAISVGLVQNRCRLDLDYSQDRIAEVDMNVVMTGAGRYVEIQGTGEEATFDEAELGKLLKLARRGIQQLREIQKQALGRSWPF
jgi:ribonuclease PH